MGLYQRENGKRVWEILFGIQGKYDGFFDVFFSTLSQ